MDREPWSHVLGLDPGWARAPRPQLSLSGWRCQLGRRHPAPGPHVTTLPTPKLLWPGEDRVRRCLTSVGLVVKDPPAKKLILSITHSGIDFSHHLKAQRGARQSVGIRPTRQVSGSEATTATSDFNHTKGAPGHQVVPSVCGAGLQCHFGDSERATARNVCSREPATRLARSRCSLHGAGGTPWGPVLSGVPPPHDPPSLVPLLTLLSPRNPLSPRTRTHLCAGTPVSVAAAPARTGWGRF